MPINRFPFDNIPNNAQGDLEGVDFQPLEFLKGFRDFQVLGDALFQEEAQRLEKKLGSNHPRVQRLKTHLKHSPERIRHLEVELELAKIKVPEVGEQDVLIHGRVVDPDERGISGLTVFLESADGKVKQDLARAQTDASGYYAFPIKADSSPKEGAVKTVVLAIRTREDLTGNVVYRHPDRLTLKPGSRQVINIPLNRSDLSPIQPNAQPGSGSPPTPTSPVNSDEWVVRGTVTRSGQSAPGLTVSLFDWEGAISEALGSATTDESGEFRIVYHTRDFQAYPGETHPDLDLKVLDEQGNLLYPSEEAKRAIRFQAGHEEVFNIDLDATPASEEPNPPGKGVR